jgi:hypothetical protein
MGMAKSIGLASYLIKRDFFFRKVHPEILKPELAAADWLLCLDQCKS